MQTLLVTDDTASWAFLKNITSISETPSYLSNQNSYKNQSIRIVNLCDSYQYQSIGYYISLIAEARLEDVVPSINHIQDTLIESIFKVIVQDIDNEIQDAFKNIKQSIVEVSLYFGKNPTQNYAVLVEKLYLLFPFHLIRFEFEKKRKWVLKTLVPLSIKKIPKYDITFMQDSAIDYFTHLNTSPLVLKNHYISHKKSLNKGIYNLAMLVEPTEGETAPSNTKAIKQFVAAGAAIGLNVHIVTKKDAKNIAKYDALFIRTTTSVNHYTYHFARCAVRDNLVVIDDPQSIVRCSNKVYLAELFNKNQILTPPTQLISKYDTHLPFIEFPCVLKKPDSSCSLGVVKIDNLKSLKTALPQFFKTSDIILVQTFMPTKFDWRIGILDNKPLYACRYFMAKNHWQIVNWDNDDRLIHEAVSIDEVPQEVIELALKSTKLIGNSLYGVDIKSIDNKAYMIEVNDNPSINFGIEDILLKYTLYEKIMGVFLQRLDAQILRT